MVIVSNVVINKCYFLFLFPPFLTLECSSLVLAEVQGKDDRLVTINNMILEKFVYFYTRGLEMYIFRFNLKRRSILHCFNLILVSKRALNFNTS